MCKKWKFDHTNKLYKHIQESVPENEANKLLRDFKVQTDHLISARRPDRVIVNKKITRRIMDFGVLQTTDKLKENKRKINTWTLRKKGI